MTTLPNGSRRTLRNTYQFALHPYETMRDMRERYGDPWFASALNGRLVMTAEPELIREMFANRDGELFDVFATQAMDAFFGSHSLLTMRGEPHKRERKLLTPPFHGERMRAYGAVMVEASRAALANLQPGQEFVALDCTTKISLEAIVRAVFGVEEREQVQEFQRVILATLDAVKPAFFFSKATQIAPFGRGAWATYMRHSNEADRLLYAQIERMKDRTQGREDILSLMLDARYDDGSRMSDTHLRDELRTLLIAGHETTAITLAWALDAVHRHPAVLRRLLEEIDPLGPDPAPDALANLPYLGAVIDETLRMYPVVDAVFRVLRKPWRFGGYELPAGVAVTAAIMVVHRREDLYPNPHAFEPERFLARKPKPWEYLPFGGGNRRCIGAAFSHYESRVALATILREYELECAQADAPQTERRSITLGPKGGVPMRLKARREASAGS
ncbi:cytochrome P450 [Enhygromyxa salina]|uniref:cytochrome P450 n=1 Tax=Enhygromyxa salina TaxID=215803 RepID=UPI000695EB47|nr:cytochrome P450 [Enhygromyxa salina]